MPPRILPRVDIRMEYPDWTVACVDDRTMCDDERSTIRLEVVSDQRLSREQTVDSRRSDRTATPFTYATCAPRKWCVCYECLLKITLQKIVKHVLFRIYADELTVCSQPWSRPRRKRTLERVRTARNFDDAIGELVRGCHIEQLDIGQDDYEAGNLVEREI